MISPPPTTTPTPEDIAISAGMAYLGRTVDIFTIKLDSIPNKPSFVLSLSEGSIKRPPIPLAETEVLVKQGESFAEFTQSLAVEAGLEGSYQGITASVESKFNKTLTQSIDTKFYRLGAIQSGYQLELSNDVTTLQSMLTDEFRRNLDSMPASELLDQYGTHVIIGVKVGARASYVCCLTTTSTLNQQQIDVAVKASYKSVGGSVGGSVAVSEEEKSLSKNVIGETSLDVTGGAPAERMALMQNNPDAWTRWAESADSYPALLSYTENGLLPIWHLASDPVRQEELKLAYDQRRAQHCMVRIFARSGGASSSRPDARVRVPDNYKLLSGGAIVTWTGKGLLLTASFPESDNTWRALAKEHVEGDSSGSMTVYALGLYDPDDLWEVASFDNTGNHEEHPTASVGITDSNYVLVGGGAQVNYTGDGVLLTASYPSNDISGWMAAAKDHKSTDSSGAITVFALGLRSKVRGVTLQPNITCSTSQQAAWPSATASPESKFVMVGGGAQVNYKDPGNMLTASYPLDSSNWQVASKEHLESSPATITAYTVGLKVLIEDY